MKTYEEVRSLLAAIEPNESTYSALDEEDLPHLERMQFDPEEWRAARAVFAASRLKSSRANVFLGRAARDPRSAVRVAVAASVGLQNHPAADEVLPLLLDDADHGVVRFALDAVRPESSKATLDKARQLVASGAEHVRTLAQERVSSGFKVAEVAAPQAEKNDGRFEVIGCCGGFKWRLHDAAGAVVTESPQTFSSRVDCEASVRAFIALTSKAKFGTTK